MKNLFIICFCVLALTVLPGLTASAQTRILRVVAYNIEADIGLTNVQATFTNSVKSSAVGPPLPGLIAPPTDTNNFAAGGVLEGIGEEVVNGNAQPLDILALQETTSNPLTVAPIINGLNIFYGVPGMYSNSTYQATESGGNPGTGNGPNAVVFNTRTVQLLSSVPVDPPGGTSQLGGVSSGKSGMYREVMRYQFAPAGVATNASNGFYIYTSHYKSGSDATANNTNSRAGEAAIVRNNMVLLPTNACIIYTGDFNTGDASEPMYGLLTAPGTNQLIDLFNPARNLTTNFDSAPIGLTESSTYLEYRDDYQMMTTNTFYGSGGLKYISGTYHAFGNNGSVFYGNSINNAFNTALNNRLATNGPVFISAAQLLVDLTGAADHLPVVADYTIPVPAPRIVNFNLVTTNLVLTVTNGITNAIYSVLMQTNPAAPLTNWTALANYTAPGGNFTLTVTNAVNPTATGRFYLLKGN